MGGHNSKRLQPEYFRWQSRNVSESLPEPWQLLFMCSLSDWVKHDAVTWGFDHRINYTTRADQRLQPWATNGRHFAVQIPAPETQDVDMPAVSMYATMTIEEKRNRYLVQTLTLPLSYFKAGVAFAEIVAYRDGVAIVQIATKTNRMDFLLIDMQAEKISFMHSEHCNTKPYLCECMLSPDTNCFLFKPNTYYMQGHCIHGVHNRIKRVQSTCAGVFHDVILESDSKDASFAFDPRFKHSRAAIANVGLSTDAEPVLCILDMKKSIILKKTEIPNRDEQLIHTLTFSPDGQYLAALMKYKLTRNIHSPHILFFTDIKMFSSDSLQCLHTFSQENLSLYGMSMTPAAIFPLFSESGACMAVPVAKKHMDDPGLTVDFRNANKLHSVALYNVPPALHLQSICRTKLRLWVQKECIAYLPLPEALKRFLLYIPTIA